MAATVRRAEAPDLDGVVGVFLDCWRRSYASVLPEPVRAAMTEESALELWRTAFARVGSTVLVAVEGSAGGDTTAAASAVDTSAGSVLGVARCSHRPGSPRGDVDSLYVSPRAQGKGLGTVLLDAVADRLTASGAQEARLWVFESNRASIAFYLSRGFVVDGRRRTETAYGVPELGLSRAIAERASAAGSSGVPA